MDEFDLSQFGIRSSDYEGKDYGDIDISKILAGIDLSENEEEELVSSRIAGIPAAKPAHQPRKPAQTPPAPKQKKEDKPPRVRSLPVRILIGVVKGVVALACAGASLAFVAHMALTWGTGTAASQSGASDVTILDKFDMCMTNEISNALDGILSIEKVYWLSDSDQVAPNPNPKNFGEVSTPGELKWLLEEAKDLIGDQEMIFNENTPAWDGDKIYYYYDETILVITWKQVFDRVVYTLSEVKIAHPSQFRRFLAGGEFGSDKQYVTTEMAKSVNAVMATSGDFYKFRRYGVVVYEGQVKRFEGNMVDTCFIDDNSNLIFAMRQDIKTQEEAQKFVDDNNIRFSLAFGPVLIVDGKACAPYSYVLGEINDHYTRAALCQKGELHYLIASAGGGGPYNNRHTIADFAKTLEGFGVDKAYALDGGQTTVVTMKDQAINFVDFGYQRQISDIIYFATALPDGGD